MRSLAAQHVAVPAALKSAVASQIRKLIADVWYTLHLSDSGAIRIAARVVAVIARDAARNVPGVRAAFGRSTHSKTAGLTEKATLQHRHPRAAAGVLGRTAVVDLAIAAQYGARLDTIAREVQQRALTELGTKTGLHDITVNVTIDDVIT
ncbi:MAG: Asp23/Gls24 family envelope stress response protein [Trebonia sp.]